jgi:hypothetical protein
VGTYLLPIRLSASRRFLSFFPAVGLPDQLALIRMHSLDNSLGVLTRGLAGQARRCRWIKLQPYHASCCIPALELTVCGPTNSRLIGMIVLRFLTNRK